MEMSTSDITSPDTYAAPPPVPTFVAPSLKKLDCIDCFSGIGGISLALSEFLTVSLYCEVNTYCTAVLTQKMKEGKLDKAPVHGDISNLYLAPSSQPQMLVGGFPCPDISSIGLQRGIVEGSRSGLFFELMRILDDCPSIQVVFLENVANILRVGLDDVVRELTQRNFNMQWTLRSAGAAGAPHCRNRWFCLACKPEGHALLDSLRPQLVKKDPNVWHTEPEARVSFKPNVKEDPSFDPNWNHRSQTLGNTVVPAVVREAFVELALTSNKWQTIASCLEDFGQPVGPPVGVYSESAMVINGIIYALPKPKIAEQNHTVEIHMRTPGQTPAPGDAASTLQRVINYPTPRRGIAHASTLTERSTRDLPTVLMNSHEAIQYVRNAGVEVDETKLHNSLVANMNYIEWMMGYPKDWTKIDGTAKPALRDDDDEFDENAESVTSDTATANKSTRKRPHRKRRSRSSVSTTAATRYLNGFHIMMKENIGLGRPLKEMATLWRGLSAEEKAAYTLQAKTQAEAEEAEALVSTSADMMAPETEAVVMAPEIEAY